MASKALPPKYLEAGQEYLAALQMLGLEPEFLGWGMDEAHDEWNLVLVTSIIEIGGPLALSRLLFRAYNLNATPKEISPFIVRTFGSETLYAPELKHLNEVKAGRVTATAVRNADGTFPTGRKAKPIPVQAIEKSVGGIRVDSRYAYLIAPRDLNRKQKTEEWTRFRENVERLAA
ncbi:MAG: hypothetical protein KGJ79_01385 [Alphaproteobacteria bacterium]|nr:hypothetical protein [Alphaproteobacteria bacterium]MDE2109765.1 hypothetical protein [Alphaproteobacteria bacterium]MDE2494389.1 hypothetical protein [Alphaproteobacteria bacterium]